jgi:hypothetical protein
MASREVILRCPLPVVEVNANHQNHEEIAKDDNVVRKGKPKSRHRHLLDMDLDINESAPENAIFRRSGCSGGVWTV